MCKVMNLYGMSVNEVLKLSDNQVALMIDHAETVTAQTVATNPEVTRAISRRLEPVARTIRSQIGSGGSSDE